MNLLRRNRVGWTDRQQVQSIYKWANLEKEEIRLHRGVAFFRALQYTCVFALAVLLLACFIYQAVEVVWGWQ